MRKTVSIAIASFNRADDLAATLAELMKLDPMPREIYVCLDGCTDHSRDMLSRFPGVSVLENEVSRGSVYSRDRLFRAVSGDWIVSLDDDSYPLQSDFITRLLDAADDHPEAGIICFKEIRLRGQDDRPYESPSESKYVASYPNCAGAIRRSLYGHGASYPTFFFHAYEEPDYCLQTYAAGYGVLFRPEIEILHRYTKVGRNKLRFHHQHSRNELLSVIMRCPVPHLFWLAPYRVVRQAVHAAQQGASWLLREPQWWFEALKLTPQAWKHRRPIAWRTYWQWIRLARNPIQANRTKLSEHFRLVNVDEKISDSLQYGEDGLE